MNGKHLHVRCMTHIHNLIVQDSLKEIGPSVKQVRQMVKYVFYKDKRTSWNAKDKMLFLNVQLGESHLFDIGKVWEGLWEV